MTLTDLQATAGHPSGDRIERPHADGLREIGWAAGLCGAAGWWWAIARGDTVLAAGWTSGGARDRDAELERALAAARTLVAARRVA